MALAAIAAAAGVEMVAPAPADTYADTYADTATGVAAGIGWITRPLHAMSPLILACLVLVCVLHHTAAALAARAAAGVPLPAGELIAAQFAASAVNRLTPAGLGGTTLLGRYLHRRGGLAPAQATAAVSALAVLGGLADIAAFGALLAVGAVLGATSMTREAPALVTRLAHLVPTGALPWTAGAVLVAAGAAALLARRRLPGAARRIPDGSRRFLAQLTAVGRSPGRLVGLLTASASTTLLLAAGFAASAVLVPSGLPASDVGALMIGYMVAAAAGNALPTPGGIGSADAALIGVLAATSMPTATAVAVVLAFRAITFWAPAAVGLGALAALRRRGAL